MVAVDASLCLQRHDATLNAISHKLRRPELHRKLSRALNPDAALFDAQRIEFAPDVALIAA